jgi:hypothetical protein
MDFRDGLGFANASRREERQRLVAQRLDRPERLAPSEF